MLPRQPNFAKKTSKQHFKTGDNFSCERHIDTRFGSERVSAIKVLNIVTFTHYKAVIYELM